MFTLGLNTAKNTHYIEKKLQIKVVQKSNFTQKHQRAHMSISPMSSATGLQRSVCLKSYNVQKWEI